MLEVMIMGNLKNLLLHCQNNLKKYEEYDSDDNGRYINQGWIEALMYIQRNYDITEKTIDNE